MTTEQTKALDRSDLTRSLSSYRKFVAIDLRHVFNNDGISYDDLKCDGDFDGHGASFPAEELPPSNSLIEIDGVPFFFPSKEAGLFNNLVLSGQTITFQPGRYKALYVLGCVDGQNGEVYDEEFTISLEDGSFLPIYVGLSNWLLWPKYQERAAFYCSHLHVPDPGQTTAPGDKIPELAEYGPRTFNGQSNPITEEFIASRIAKGIWEPKIWIQKAGLPTEKNIVGITVMDNLNFHVFCMTVEESLE